MACRICGAEDAVIRPAKRNTLCGACNKATPPKVSRAEFDQAYWDGKPETVPSETKREFYADYLASEDTLESYKAATSFSLE